MARMKDNGNLVSTVNPVDAAAAPASFPTPAPASVPAPVPTAPLGAAVPPPASASANAQARLVARPGNRWVNGKMRCPMCKAPVEIKGSHVGPLSDAGKREVTRNCRCTGHGHGAPHTFKHVETV